MPVNAGVSKIYRQASIGKKLCTPIASRRTSHQIRRIATTSREWCWVTQRRQRFVQHVAFCIVIEPPGRKVRVSAGRTVNGKLQNDRLSLAWVQRTRSSRMHPDSLHLHRRLLLTAGMRRPDSNRGQSNHSLLHEIMVALTPTVTRARRPRRSGARGYRSKGGIGHRWSSARKVTIRLEAAVKLERRRIVDLNVLGIRVFGIQEDAAFFLNHHRGYKERRRLSARLPG